MVERRRLARFLLLPEQLVGARLVERQGVAEMYVVSFATVL